MSLTTPAPAAPPSPTDAVARVPAGPWAVGVSGGADSVALLLLLRERRDVAPQVVHLDHQTRGQASANDAGFVADLARSLGVPCTVARRDELEPTVPNLPANVSARFRALRLALFHRVVTQHGLNGVLLAHHADDVAETVLHRLVRGSGPTGLAGIASCCVIGGLRVRRPLLEVKRSALREYLAARGQPWREDASNASDDYLRNRIRRLLEADPALSPVLLELAGACRALRDWVQARTPPAGAKLSATLLRSLPPLLAREQSRQWLAGRGVPPDELTGPVVERLVSLAAAPTAPRAARADFPGRIIVRRDGEWLCAESQRPL